MNQIIRSSVVLILFSLGIILFQFSCQKQANAQTNSQQGKVLFVKSFVSGQNEFSEIWVTNFNGSNPQRLNINLPSGFKIDGENGPTISPDGQLIFFGVWSPSLGVSHIYSCKLDGTNLVKIVDGTGSSEVNVGSAF